MKQIAIYGKGGIGKSTVSANISYQLSDRGLKVAQIGCDPKHDSTRLLLDGRMQTTVLEHMDSGSGELGDTVSLGKKDVICIETGGPEPGVGCAGRGILTAFNFLEKNSVIPSDTDVVLYDVLGDVVCGGFAVPLRRKYADAVFIVTSGEFMSLYAANNVLKGIRNFDGDTGRVAGLILNCRGNEGEFPYVKNFADAVGLPIVTAIPRSPKFSQAESNGKTVSEMFPGSEESTAVSAVADIVSDILRGKGSLHPANPLGDEDMDLVAKGLHVPRKTVSCPTAGKRHLALNEKDALRSCGSAMAVSCCLEILDAEVVVHGPGSCRYFFTFARDAGAVFEGKADRMRSMADRVFCTDLDDRSSIFGGREKLEKVLRGRAEAGSKTVFVVTTCVPGIIGDDLSGICASMSERYPATRFVPVPADGVLNGGGVQIRDLAIRIICALADRDVPRDGRSVNIIGHSGTSDRTMAAADDTFRMIEGLGLKVNCSFMDENRMSDIAGLGRGCIDVMCGYSVGNVRNCAAIEEVCGIPAYGEPMPVGLRGCESWISGFADRMDVPEEVSLALIGSLRRDVDAFRDRYGGRFAGLTAALYVQTSSDTDWLFEILDILGVKVVRVFCPVNNVWSLADAERYGKAVAETEYDVDYETLVKRLDEVRPDMVIGSNIMMSQLKFPHILVRRPYPGVRSALEYGRRIARMLEMRNL